MAAQSNKMHRSGRGFEFPLYGSDTEVTINFTVTLRGDYIDDIVAYSKSARNGTSDVLQDLLVKAIDRRRAEDAEWYKK